MFMLYVICLCYIVNENLVLENSIYIKFFFEMQYFLLENLLIKGTVSFGNKLFWSSTHLLDINFCANNNCSEVFILKKSKIHMRRHFPRIDMGWRPLAHVCLWLRVSSCLHSTRKRHIVSINMASIKVEHCLQFLVFRSFYFLIDIIKCNRNLRGYYNFSRSFYWNRLVKRWYFPFKWKV